MKIGNFDLERDGVYIVAELSANHNQNKKIALESIKAAKEAGANAIKIQTYTPDTITLNCDNPDFLIDGGTIWDGTRLYDLYSKAYTPWEWHEDLFNYAKKINIDIFSTPFDKSAVDFLEQFDPPAYKIASFEITDYELIRHTAIKKKPIIISTGIATIGEIQDVIDICRSVGNSEIILLKCTSEYPAPLDEANLKIIKNMKETFGVEVGFSDHTLGNVASIVATALGAKIIEKHFIIDKKIGGVDSSFSMDKDEFGLMVKSIRESEKLLGCVNYSLNDSVKKQRRFARSLYASKNIKKGEVFTTDNIKSVRPFYSLHPKYLDNILGKSSNRDYKFGDRIEFNF